MTLRPMIGKMTALLVPLALATAGATTAFAQTGTPAPTALPAPAVAPAPAAVPATCASGTCGMGIAQPCSSGTCVTCQSHDCPPKFVHCTPEGPNIKFKCACPKPVCDPCDLDPTGNYGYTPTCWRPWMAPPNYSHCPVPTPAQFMPIVNEKEVISDNMLPPPPNK